MTLKFNGIHGSGRGICDREGRFAGWGWLGGLGENRESSRVTSFRVLGIVGVEMGVL